MKPTLSVILPVRNGAATVGRAVRSTLAALPDDAELLVHDDGSTDRTPAVLASVRDRRLHVSTGAGDGVANALNGLLARAAAPLVARMDADDVALPGRFRHQLRVARHVDLVFSGHVRFGPSLGSFRQKRPWHLSPETVRVWLALENPLLHPAMLGRTDLIREAGGYRPGPAEDYDLWLRLAARGARIERLLMPGVGYRMHPGQVTMGRSYLASLLRDTDLAEAHSELARALGWTGAPMFSLLWRPARTEEHRVLKAAYWSFVADLSRTLPRFEGLLLRQALERTWAGSDVAGWTAADDQVSGP